MSCIQSVNIIVYVVIVCGKPTLEPGTDYYCHNVTVTFTCFAHQIIITEWVVPDERSIRFVVDQGLYVGQTFNRTNQFFSIVTNITERNGSAADVTTELRIDTLGLKNGTNITCGIYKYNGYSGSTSLIYFPGYSLS